MITKIINFIKYLIDVFKKPLDKKTEPNYCQTFKMAFNNDLRTMRTGLKKDPVDERDIIKVSATIKTHGEGAIVGNKNLPREFSLKKYAPPTNKFNQYSTSACGGFSASALMYILIRKMEELSGNPIESASDLLSPLWIYYHARKNDGYGAENYDRGTTLRSVMRALKDPGVLFDKYFSFSKNTPVTKPDASLMSIPRFNIEGYQRIVTNEGDKTIYTLKDVLSNEKLPIEAGVILYEEQMTNFRWNGYLKPVDLDTAHCIGGHAVCITGYKMDSKGQCWVEFINSWGSDFGDDGYGYFPIEWLNDDNYVIDLWTLDKEYF